MISKKKADKTLQEAKPPKILRPGTLPMFDVLIVDADSLIYQIAWTTEGSKECIKRFDRVIADLMLRTDCYTCHVLVKGDWNFRNFIDENYKIKRRKNDYTTDEVKKRTADLLTYVQGSYGSCEDGGEADDWAAILQRKYIQDGLTPVLAHIDKDLNMIPGWHYHIKLKDFFYQTPEQAFYFMMKQFLSGDMASDSIPGLHQIGEIKAAEKLRGTRLSDLSSKVIYLWKNHTPGIQTNDPDAESTVLRGLSMRARYTQMLKSINLLYLRTDPEHLRELTEREIREIMTWDDFENNPVIDQELELIRIGVYSCTPATYTIGEIPPGTFANQKRENQLEIAKEVAEGKRTKYADDVERNGNLQTKVRYKTANVTSRMRSLIKRVGDESKIGQKRHTGGGKVATSKGKSLGGVVLAQSQRRSGKVQS